MVQELNDRIYRQIFGDEPKGHYTSGDQRKFVRANCKHCGTKLRSYGTIYHKKCLAIIKGEKK